MRVDCVHDDVSEIACHAGARGKLFPVVILGKGEGFLNVRGFPLFVGMTNKSGGRNYFKSAKNVGCASSAASAFARFSRFP
jgi:hypothetical protein